MKKRILSLVLSFATVVGLLSACGEATASSGNGESKQQVDTTNENVDLVNMDNVEPTTIKVWTLNRHDADYMNELVQKFNEENPDIFVDYTIYTENFEQAVDMAFATDDVPDILFDGGSIYSKYVGQGKFEPLNNYLSDDMRAKFGNDSFLEGINMVDGNIYSLPAIGTTARLIYNKNIFERAGITKVPETVEEMADTAIEISNKLSGEGVYGFAANLMSPAGALNRSVDFILMRSGGTYRGYDFRKGQYDFSGYKAILEEYQRMFDNNGALPGCESLDIDPLRSQFANGKIGMYISWTHSEPGVYENQFPTTENWDVAQLPTVSGNVDGSQHMLLAGRWFLMTSASPNKDKAWRVMEMLYSDDTLKGYHERGLGNVTVQSVLDQIEEQPETIKKMPNLAFTDNDKIWPPAPADVISIAPEGKNMYEVFAEIIFGQERDIDTALTDLNDRYNKALSAEIEAGSIEPIIYENFDPKNPAAVFN